ncbi:hypothetical protein HDU76_009473 [Blyttiomyces sp. JEL0837]|nr:hypothetical protein HDU76_009473 [Blyttiomyces sp. JEL0837]
MITLHLQSTQNGIMLLALTYLHPYLNLSKPISIIFEISSNLGAWLNVLPWVYAAMTGAVVKVGDGQILGNVNGVVPTDNVLFNERIGMMLMTCALGDILAWGIVFIVLFGKFVFGQNDAKTVSSKKKA